MSKHSSIPRAARLLSAATASFLLLAASSILASADEIKVLASVALTSTLNELAPRFESASGNKLTIGYGLAAQLKQHILDGEATDVAILIRPMMEDLLKRGKLSGSLENFGGTPVAIAIRAGAPKPDISSVDALKRTLLAARSISYADPAKGGASGVVFAKAIERLGLTEKLKAKTILVPGAQAPELVAKGEAELGVAQASEIVAVNGAEVLGPLPGDLGSVTLFTAGVGESSKVPDAAKALIKFLTGPIAAPVLKAKGFEPG
jgi:molybdate transport system substrate-binding protein